MSKKKKIILIAAAAAVVVVAAVAIVCGVTLSGGGPYSGTVLDTNGTPVAGVSVSDGRHVVKTDENGTFKLNGYRKTRFICVSTPAGYVCDNYYLPVSDDISSYDFTLTPSERTAQDNYSFLQISDTEIGETALATGWKTYRRPCRNTNRRFWYIPAICAMKTASVCTRNR